MGYFNSIKYCICDVFYKIRECKWKFIGCVAVSLIGFALGIAFFCMSGYGWWYYNRCEFASRLPAADFGVFISFVALTALLYVLYLLCGMTRITHYLSYLVNIVACIYCGATVAAVFVYSTAWGVLFTVFVAVPDLAVKCFACFVSVCERSLCRTFCESARDLKQLAVVLAVGLLYKIIALFVILKLLTALI